MMTAEGATPVPLEGAWALRGSVFDFASTGWLPPFALRPTPRAQASPQRMFDALVSLPAGASAFWPASELRGAIAVFVWLSNQRVTHVNPVPLRSAHLRDGEIVASARFQLSAEESRGLPAVLVLRDNQWLPPAAPGVAPEFFGSLVRQAGAPAPRLDVIHLNNLDARHRAAAIEALVVARHASALEALLRDPAAGSAAIDWMRLREAAVRAGATESLRVLLSAGPKIPPDTLTTLLETAVSNRQEACALALVEHAGRERTRVPRSDEIAAFATEEGLVRLLPALGESALPAVIKRLDRESFARIVRQGHADMLRVLLQHGLKPTRVDPDATALALAATLQDRELAGLYLRAGGKADPLSSAVDAPLVHAMKAGAREIAADLLAAGANPNRTRSGGTNPLAAAVLSADAGMAPWALSRSQIRFSADTLRAALELALRLRRASAVAALTKAGATLAPATVRALAEDIFAVDAADVWDAFLAQGGSPDERLFGAWTAAEVALAAGATECSRRMEQRGMKTKPQPLAVPDLPPAPTELVVPASLRAPDRAWPALALKVSGVVDEQGAFRCVGVRGSDDILFVYQLRMAAAKFRFTPAQRAGKAVRARVEFALNLEAAPQRIFRTTELDLPPLALSENGRTVGYVGVNTGGMWQGFGTPGASGLLNEIASVLYALDTGGIETTSNPIRDVDGRIMPLVSFTIGRDGAVRDSKIQWAQDHFDSKAALQRTSKMRYLPGIAQGRAVEVPMVLRVSGR